MEAHPSRVQGPGTVRRATRSGRKKLRLSYLHTAVQSEIDSFPPSRPYFLYWCVFVQTIMLIVALGAYPIASIDYKEVSVSGAVTDTNGGKMTATRTEVGNIFVGPHNQILLALGGIFAPCMRRDPNVQAYLNSSIVSVDEYGCCLRETGDGLRCYSSQADNCTENNLQTFHNESVCYGQTCCNAGDWPDCERVPDSSLPSSEEYDVCRCEVVARPCCHGLFGDCDIRTQSECDFFYGVYEDDATTCAEVDTLQSVCGLSAFKNVRVPDQWYRLLLAPFIPAGVIHFFLFTGAQYFIGRTIEQTIGTTRFVLIYLCCVIGGYAVSAILTPYQVKVGASPAVYGLLGTKIVSLINSWKEVKSPCRDLFTQILLSALALILGLLPFIDNFSHVAGFYFGIVSSMAFLPWHAVHTLERGKRRVMNIVGFILTVASLTTALVLLFTGFEANCSWCHSVNCVNFVPGFCAQTGYEL
eukprot:m.126572 g.126572  ORF g.126572 m.126572 type:complete len:471 (+) comp13835_c2_seq1:145-1557(+)